MELRRGKPSRRLRGVLAGWLVLFAVVFFIDDILSVIVGSGNAGINLSKAKVVFAVGVKAGIAVLAHGGFRVMVLSVRWWPFPQSIALPYCSQAWPYTKVQAYDLVQSEPGSSSIYDLHPNAPGSLARTLHTQPVDSQ